VSHLQNKPEIWNIERLLDEQLGKTMLLVTPSVSVKVAENLPFRLGSGCEILPNDLDTLIVIGGGTLIDHAKVWRAHQSPETQLIAIPSLWGSGAEMSPVAVLNQLDKKEIQIGDEFIPDICCFWPQLSRSVPSHLALYACGDAWSHALEGFLSPLADGKVQQDLADLIREMIDLPLGNDSRWFQLSARACIGHSQAGVGLVHGIAHTLEHSLRTRYPGAGWGHAKLCSLFLHPVMEFNRKYSPKWKRLNQQYQLDGEAILKRLQNLHDPESYKQVLGLLDQHWMKILSDPCSRINSTLVRPSSKEFFLEYALQ
jgi:alcohol dehydrogenase class IV